jgi:hypothetical protein
MLPWRAGLVVAAALLIVGLAMPHGGKGGRAQAATTLAGSQGTDASLQDTPSAVSVSATQGPFTGLHVHVNQTQNLSDQAISVTWSGGVPTYSGATPGGPFQLTYAGDFLQMMECWSTDPNTPPTPEQCEFGGEAAGYGAYPVSEGTHAYERTLAVKGWTCGAGAPTPCTDYATVAALAASSNGSLAYVDPTTQWAVDPFLAVDGACGSPPCLVPLQVDFGCCTTLPWQHSFDQNPYFNFTTTNEVDFARTYGDGTGQVLFTAASALKAPGLGCGQASLTKPDGTPYTPQCWLVIVPRGTAAQENLTGDVEPVPIVDTSPLAASAWANRITIPLGFAPLSAGCALSGNVRRVVGSELAAAAVASWQPVLCQTAGNPPYSYASLSDDSARSQLAGGASGGAGMAVMTNAVDPSSVDPMNPVVYAPLTLSGAAIAFNIQRIPARVNGADVAEEVPLAGTQVIHVFLTPRLVAKLLTESYQGQIYGYNPQNPGPEAWAVHNPGTIVEDPDFVQFNPEFAELREIEPVDASGIVVEEPSSDAAALVWNWILADPEASAWLAGQPDAWGMAVNPYYSTSATSNPSGVGFGMPTPNSYPKADPYCFHDLDLIGGGNETPRPLCMQDWSPYVNTMRDAAAATRAANSGAKLSLQIGAASPDTAWGANGPQITGQHFIVSITDTASAARYGLQTASLSRSGDDGASRTFVAADPAGLLNGEQAMKSSAVPGVLSPNPGTTAAGAYPLAMVTYAAVTPESLDQSARHDYAAFISYAAQGGQAPGFSPGSLPPGYVSLPAALATEAQSAVSTILNPPSETTTTTTTTTATTTTTEAAATTTTVLPTATPTSAVAQSAAGAPRPSTASPTTRAPSTTTTLSPAAPAPPVSEALPARPAVVRTPGAHVGFVRFAIPLALALGLASTTGAVVTRRRTG